MPIPAITITGIGYGCQGRTGKASSNPFNLRMWRSRNEGTVGAKRKSIADSANAKNRKAKIGLPYTRSAYCLKTPKASNTIVITREQLIRCRTQSAYNKPLTQLYQ